MHNRTPWLIICVLCAAVSAIRADVSPEVIKRCKLATGMVRVVDEAEGTAFHIGGGVFLTNYHVIEEAVGGARIELCLNPGEKNQRLLKARLARTDAKRDLAIITVDDKELPPALEIGNVDSLIESLTVAVFGFPFGTDLALGEAEFPNVSVNVGRISSLRRAEGKLALIQTDTPVSPGNSGGPLVDSSGRVVGVIQAHVPGVALTFAKPADQVRRFLFGSDLTLRVEPLQFAPGTQSTVTISAHELLQEGIPMQATLQLSAFPRDKRDYRTEGSKGVYTVSAPVVPAAASPPMTGGPSKTVNYTILVSRLGDPQLLATQKGMIDADGVHTELVRANPASEFSGSGATNLPSRYPCYRFAKNGHFYAAVHLGRNLSWAEAASIASQLVYRGKQGHLATITSRDEDLFVFQHFPHPREKGYWLGGFQDTKSPEFKEPTGGWRWITGERWRYDNWSPRQPDDYNGLSNYLHFFEDGTWDEAYTVSEIQFGFIVEFQ